LSYSIKSVHGGPTPLSLVYNPAAKNALVIVKHQRLPGCRGTLWIIEYHLDTVRGVLSHSARLIGLAVAGLGLTAQWPVLWGAVNPVHFLYRDRLPHQGWVVMSLNYGKYVVLHIFAGDIPGLTGPANIQALALSQGIKPKTLVLTDDLTFKVLDSARCHRQVAGEKFTKASFSYETNTGTVFSLGIWQPKGGRFFADIGFFQLP
jgi:hypothetical protein